MHPAQATTEVHVTTGRHIPARAADYARDKIGRLAHLAHRPVLSARVRLSRHGDRARPVVAQGNLDVNGRLVRAQVEAASAHEAIDLLADVLRHRLDKLAPHRLVHRDTVPPQEWRHAAEPVLARGRDRLPEDEREIVRHKTIGLTRTTVDDAAAEMNQLGYDFHLFTEAATGRDRVLYRAGDTGYRLAQTVPPADAPAGSLPVTVSPHPAPVLTPAQARDRLGLLGLPFLFFVDAGRDRGCVLYHRYDGHYGLLSPAE
ncbi:ribosome hibernation promotion factor [Amycolatopsis thermoflava]|uniref:ribosome hibernation promotion factor n=1 Tax=Amycolatopsis thermoflava TaxID=84480 RepID=UPI003815233F